MSVAVYMILSWVIIIMTHQVTSLFTTIIAKCKHVPCTPEAKCLPPCKSRLHLFFLQALYAYALIVAMHASMTLIVYLWSWFKIFSHYENHRKWQPGMLCLSPLTTSIFMTMYSITVTSVCFFLHVTPIVCIITTIVCSCEHINILVHAWVAW